jgi:hypothetical protein
LRKQSQDSVVSIDNQGLGVLRHDRPCEPLVSITSLFVMGL